MKRRSSASRWSSSAPSNFEVVRTQPARAGASADRAGFSSVGDGTWAGAPGELKKIESMISALMPLRMPSTRTELWFT